MSYPSYPDYQEVSLDWLDQMPSHWAVKRLRHVTDLNPGKSRVRGYDPDMETTFLPMEAVGEDGGLDLMSTKPLSDVIDGYTYFQENDVAYAKITPCFENGKAAILRGLTNGIGFGTTELTVLRPHSDQATPDYLFRVITSEPFRSLGESSMYGAGGQKRVPDDFARNFSIPWPPLPEQTQIARFLDHQTARIDALIAEQQRLIELLKEKRQAVISHAVTKGLDPDVAMKDSGVEWLGEVPEHWEVWKLAHCLQEGFQNGISPSLSDDDTGVKTFSISAVRSGLLELEGNTKIADLSLDEARSYFIDRGDVLIIRGNGNINLVGTGCVVKERPAEDYVYPDILFRCRTIEKQLLPEYLVSLLSSARLRPQIECLTRTTNGTHKISGDKLSTLRLPIPPVEEQARIMDDLHRGNVSIECLLDEAFLATKLLQERRSALISAAVTGKIDVRDWDPPVSETFPQSTAGEEAPA